jgi:O-acetyl-ADP-ribose deacetylase
MIDSQRSGDRVQASADLQGCIEVVQGDITKLDVDAIVNAANETLLGGGGVDGAIHRAAGPELVQACRQIPEVRPNVRCPTGEARITSGYRLPARYVIHTVGPVWRGGNHREPLLLAAAYRNCLELAASNGLCSIAFPAVSAGVYGYPVDQAAAIAVREVRAALSTRPGIGRVLLVAFGHQVAEALTQALAQA